MWATSKSTHGMKGISRRKPGNIVVAESYDLWHQADLGSFSATQYWQETKFFSNITPQKTWLNQGIWVDLKLRIRKLAAEEGPVWIFTGPIYYEQLVEFEKTKSFQRHKAYVERNQDWVDNPSFANGALNYSEPLPIPKADEEGVSYEVPAGYCKVVVVPDFDDPTQTWCAFFIFGQDTTRHSDSIMPYLYNIDTVEALAGVDLLWELDDELEDKLEHLYFNETVVGNRPEVSEIGLTIRYSGGG